jgi:hypothetical protein
MTGGIVRRGDTVLRPVGSWSPAVHEYLRHLESAGFDGSPRVLGVDGRFEVLSYLGGEVAADPLWQPGYGHRLPAFARAEPAPARCRRSAAQAARRLGRVPAEAHRIPAPPFPAPAGRDRLAW